MIHFLFAVVVLIILFLLLTLGVIAGTKFGRWELQRDTESKLQVVSVAEGSVFAILGLLIAFTFSGAYDRYEARKMHIIDEANAYSTAYTHLKMLAPETQPALRQLLKNYLDQRLIIYKNIPHIFKVKDEIKKADVLEEQIWDNALQAMKITNISVTTEMLVPALSDMFDKANKGYYMALVHSPPFVFLLLISLAVLGAFLTGYSVSENKKNHSIHIVSFIVISTLTIFLIINLELPRIGIIRIDKFDKILIDVRAKWDQPTH